MATEPSRAEDYTIASGAWTTPTPDSTLPVVIACDVNFPSTPSDGCLFEKGGAGNGIWCGLRDTSSTATFRVRAGSGSTLPQSTTAVLDITDFPADGAQHNVVIHVNPTSGNEIIRLWIDDEYKGEATVSGSQMGGGNWEGGGSGGYLTGVNSNVSGEPTSAWPDTTGASSLRLYENETLDAPSGISVSLDTSQAGDTVSASGGPVVAGALDTSQAGDTLEADDTITPASGALDLAQGGDTLSADGSVLVVGAAEPEQGGDTLGATVNVPTFVVDGDNIEFDGDRAGDIMEGDGDRAGDFLVYDANAQATVDVAQTDNSLTSAGSSDVVGGLDAAQAANAISADATVRIDGALFATVSSDSVTVEGTSAVTASVSATQDDNSIIADAFVPPYEDATGESELTQDGDVALIAAFQGTIRTPEIRTATIPAGLRSVAIPYQDRTAVAA